MPVEQVEVPVEETVEQPPVVRQPSMPAVALLGDGRVDQVG
jgi:hypothetical protein